MSTAYPPPAAAPPPPPSAYAGAPGPSRPVDVTMTIVLIVLLALGGLVSLTFGLFLSMAAGSCRDSACTDRVAIAVLVVELAPIVAWVPTTVWAVVRMVRRKVAFWVPLLGIPVYVLLVLAGLSFLGP